MDHLRPISDSISIAGQPTEEDLQELKDEGYVAVVNLRNDGEPDQPIGTAAEAELAREIGLAYLHVGVGATPLTESAVGRFCEFVDAQTAAGKVLVHCRSGGRAAALVLIQQAKALGWTPRDAVAKGEAMGLRVGGGLKMTVEMYLNDHPTA